MPDAPKYELTYFNGRGLAEGARFLFALGGVPFADKRFPLKVLDWKAFQFERPEFDAAKAEGKLDASLGKVPFLTVDGDTVIPQR